MFNIYKFKCPIFDPLKLIRSPDQLYLDPRGEPDLTPIINESDFSDYDFVKTETFGRGKIFDYQHTGYENHKILKLRKHVINDTITCKKKIMDINFIQESEIINYDKSYDEKKIHEWKNNRRFDINSVNDSFLHNIVLTQKKQSGVWNFVIYSKTPELEQKTGESTDTPIIIKIFPASFRIMDIERINNSNPDVIIFENGFNSIIDFNMNDTIVCIIFGDNYDQPLNMDFMSINLKKIKFGKNCNSYIKKCSIQSRLEIIECDTFQNFQKGYLPDTLKYIIFHNTNDHIKFDIKITKSIIVSTSAIDKKMKKYECYEYVEQHNKFKKDFFINTVFCGRKYDKDCANNDLIGPRIGTTIETRVGTLTHSGHTLLYHGNKIVCIKDKNKITTEEYISVFNICLIDDDKHKRTWIKTQNISFMNKIFIVDNIKTESNTYQKKRY